MTPPTSWPSSGAHAQSGKDAALAEIRRRWPAISETVLPVTLARILAAPVAPPSDYRDQGEQVLDNRRRAMRR